jgi:hypothetical protein
MESINRRECERNGGKWSGYLHCHYEHLKIGSNQLLFDSSNWNIPQRVVISAVNDYIHESQPHTAIISHQIISLDRKYNSLDSVDTKVNIFDNDLPSVQVSASESGLLVSESGGLFDEYTLRLSSKPRTNVVVNVFENLSSRGIQQLRVHLVPGRGSDYFKSCPFMDYRTDDDHNVISPCLHPACWLGNYSLANSMSPSDHFAYLQERKAKLENFSNYNISHSETLAGDWRDLNRYSNVQGLSPHVHSSHDCTLVVRRYCESAQGLKDKACQTISPDPRVRLCPFQKPTFNSETIIWPCVAEACKKYSIGSNREKFHCRALIYQFCHKVNDPACRFMLPYATLEGSTDNSSKHLNSSYMNYRRLYENHLDIYEYLELEKRSRHHNNSWKAMANYTKHVNGSLPELHHTYDPVKDAKIFAGAEGPGLQVLFTADNWNIPRVLRVYAVDDFYAEEHRHFATISHSISSQSDPSYAVLGVDNITVT